jgi:hypothetical protein
MDTSKDFDEMTLEEILSIAGNQETAHDLEDGEGSELFEDDPYFRG